MSNGPLTTRRYGVSEVLAMMDIAKAHLHLLVAISFVVVFQLVVPILHETGSED